MARKYYSTWVNAEGDTCQLDFYFASYSGAAIELSSGMRAFVLKEFNSDNDFYKPIRPQQAEFEILADNVTLESFLFNNDNEVSIQFLWNGSVYWRGWLIQDDFEESWIDSKHFITLRATEQLSGLNIISPTLTVGHSTPLAFILNAISTTSISNTVDYGLRVVNNLFYETMTDKDVDNTATCLDQMYISNSTFQKTLTTYDDYQTILEKINTSFNQTIFQYRGAAYLMRMSEFLTYTANIPGIQYQPLNIVAPVIATSENFITYIGIDEYIKPIMPEMLRQVVRPYKKFQIDFKYEFPPEILCNEGFIKGTLISETSTQKNYNLDDWTLYKGSRETPTAAITTKGRQIDYAATGEPLDNFAFYSYDIAGFNTYTWLQSCDIKIIAGSWIDIEFDTFFNSTLGFTNFVIAQVLFIRDESLQYRYGLNNDGQWVLSPTDFDNATVPFITGSQEAGTNRRYFNTKIRSNQVPYTGIVKVLLMAKSTELSTAVRQIKNLTFNINTLVNGKNDVKIIGDYDRYTKTEDIKNNYNDTIYLDDGENPYWKGVIFDSFMDRTGDNWYRMQYQSETFTFKREKAIAHWLLNRRYRQLITGNFYGLTWNSRDDLIGLMNRFIFTNDAPTKQFMIVNLQEMDFVSCQWKATLMETYDSTIDTSFTDYPPHSFDFLYSE